MAEDFTPITTQEDFNSRLNDRLQRERAKFADYEELKSKAEKYKDYDDLKSQVESLTGDKTKLTNDLATANSTIEEQKAKIKGYETGSVKTRIANELGIPYEMVDRLKGETEEEIRKDAETVRKLMGTSRTTVLPLRSDDEGKNKDQEYRELLKNLTRKGE